MALGKARSAAPSWPPRATRAAAHVGRVTLATLVADALYRLAIRSHLRRAIGV